MALRYYFDLVCPYSYILGFEVERAEDDGLAEIEWLPFELRPTPKELPEPRGTYIRGHWRDHVYGLAATHAVEITRPALPTPLDASPGAALVRRGRGAG